MRTDVLQNKAHIVKLGNGKIENVGTSHTHETYKNILPSGEIKEGVKRNEAHVPTYEEVKNIELQKLKKR